MDINALILEIIPPSDYHHRNGFSNREIIDGLTNDIKSLVEDKLIELQSNSDDSLIADTLAYMKSVKAVPTLRTVLNRVTEPMDKIVFASRIFKIQPSPDLGAIALQAFQGIEDYRAKIAAFCFLATFNDPSINQILENYATDENYLLSSVAKRALANPC